MNEVKHTPEEDNGRWRRGNEVVTVIVRETGGIRMTGDTWWTCCDAATWAAWKAHHGWKKIEASR